MTKAASDLGVTRAVGIEARRDHGAQDRCASASPTPTAAACPRAGSAGSSSSSSSLPWSRSIPQVIDAGNLNAKYDVLIFADGILPENDGPAGRSLRPASALGRARGRVRAVARPLFGGEERSRDQGLRGGGREGHRHRRFDEHRPSPRPRRGPPRRAHGRRPEGSRPRQVLRAGLGPARRGGHHASPGLGRHAGRGCPLRQLAGLRTQAERRRCAG